VFVSIFAQLGDLVASKLKRAYDIKDFGKIFPGHGGVLDRFDSTLIAAALMFVICYMIGVI
jgi:phosphatidate cytidylyltransferase